MISALPCISRTMPPRLGEQFRSKFRFDQRAAFPSAEDQMEKDVAARMRHYLPPLRGWLSYAHPRLCAVGCIISPLCGCTKNLPTCSQILLVAERDTVCDRYHTNHLKSAPIVSSPLTSPLRCPPPRDIKDETSRAIVASRAFYPNLSSLVRHLTFNRLKRLKLASATGLRFGDSGPRRV
jgi:hypothetical protein